MIVATMLLARITSPFLYFGCWDATVRKSMRSIEVLVDKEGESMGGGGFVDGGG